MFVACRITWLLFSLGFVMLGFVGFGLGDLVRGSGWVWFYLYFGGFLRFAAWIWLYV